MEWCKRIIRKYLNKNIVVKHFIKFSIVGLFSTLIDISFYLFFERILFIYYLYAAGLSFMIAATFSFYLNCFWTFRIDHGNKTNQYLKFLLVATGGLLLTELILFILVDKYDWYDILAKVVAIGVVVNWNFKKHLPLEKIKENNSNIDISVIIPVYNERKVIKDTISKVKEYLKNKFNSFEIIVVDDKSTDSTVEILNNIDNIKVLKNLNNHGKGYSVAKGVKEAKGKLILFMDADSSTSITELDNFLKYTDNYDLIIGSRALKDSKIHTKQNIIKRILGKLGNLVIRLMIFSRIKDTQCGFKLFNNKVKYLFEKLTIEDWGFDFELIFLTRKYSLNIKELPVEWNNNLDSKVKWIDYIKTLLQVFKVRFNNLINKYK